MDVNKVIPHRIRTLPTFSSLTAAALTAGYSHKKEILKNLNVSIKKGDFAVLLGPNGSGKSTLIKALVGELKPLHGEVLLGEQPLEHYAPKLRARQIAYVPQIAGSTNGLRVKEYLAFSRYPYGSIFRRLSEADRKAIEAAAGECGVTHLLNGFVDDLSGGQRQKVFLAAAVAQQTDVLVLDEPTTFLDVKAQQEIMAILSRLHASGKTIVTVIHDLNQAIKFGKRVVVMKDGVIHADGLPNKVITRALVNEVFGVTPVFGESSGKTMILDVNIKPQKDQG